MTALIFGLLNSIVSGLSAVLNWLFDKDRLANKKEERRQADVDAVATEIEAAAKGDDIAAAKTQKRVEDWLRK